MIIFAYNFEHNKTNDIISECVKNNIKIEFIIAQNKKKLNIAKLPFNYSKSEPAKIHPRDLANKLNISYIIQDHNSTDTLKLLDKIKPKLGMVAGARIISGKVINKFSIGIINFHPGNLPEVRGLYSIPRAIKKGAKIKVTSHLIDSKIDAGNLIEKKEVRVLKDDTIFDISKRSYLTEISLVTSSVKKALDENFTELDINSSPYDYQIPFKSLEEFEECFKLYKEKLR